MCYRKLFIPAIFILCLFFAVTASSSDGFSPSIPEWLVGTWHNAYESNTKRFIYLTFDQHSIKIKYGFEIPLVLKELTEHEIGYRYVGEECLEGKYRVWLERTPEDRICYEFVRRRPIVNDYDSLSFLVIRDGKEREFHKAGAGRDLMRYNWM